MEWQGDVGKIRTAIVTGTGVPLLMFLAWDAAILGSLGDAQVNKGCTRIGIFSIQSTLAMREAL